MSIRSTKLSTILGRMQRFQDVLQNSNEVYQVRDIDEAIRALRRLIQFPWALQKGSLRVFSDVYEYPVATDHDELAYLDDSKAEDYSQKARFKYTSLQQFYEDPNNRNQIAEIWNGNERKLGVNFKTLNLSNQILDNGEIASYYTGSDDAGTPVLDQVFYKEGNGSIRVPVTYSAGTATIKCSLPNSIADTLYRRKYHFRWVYLPVVPTAIEMRLQTDDSNYLATTSITTQFDGTPFKANQWNLIAHDLNTATATGTFNENSIVSEKIILTIPATGSGDYYIDAGYLREWTLIDYWYYSIYNIIASSGATASKEYFYDDTATPAYDTNDSLVGDSEWADCVSYFAIITNLIDIKAKTETITMFQNRLNDAWDALMMKYPSLDPVIITDKYNFVDDFLTPAGF